MFAKAIEANVKQNRKPSPASEAKKESVWLEEKAITRWFMGLCRALKGAI
jgi:hypothetical protein